MAIPRKAIRTNKVATSPHFGRILQEYNDRLARDGRVNEKKFYQDIVAGVVPGYSLMAWYQFIRKFRLPSGKLAVNTVVAIPSTVVTPTEIMEQKDKITNTMLSNQQATQAGIQAALNLGGQALLELLQNPQLLTPEKRADIMFKAMKAQDSRIHAIGKVREDDREQKKFDRAFDNAAY